MKVAAILAAVLLCASAEAASLTRGPFLQQTTSEATRIVAHTDVNARVEVAVTGSGGDESVRATSTGTRHVLPLTELPAGTSITYRVLVDGEVKSGPHTFRTPGLRGTPEGGEAVIGVVGDMGSGGVNEKANVQRLVEAGAELILTVGDNSYPEGAAAEWDPKFFRPFAPLLPRATLAPAPGDHEYLTPYAQGYLDAFELPAQPGGERYYSFDWGDLHVAVVDSNCVDPLEPATSGCSGAEMVSWLEDDLSRSDAPWKIVTMHRAALATGAYGHSAKVANALMPIFERTGVDLVFQGHNHFYERSWPVRGGEVVKQDYREAGAPVYVTSGGSGDWVYESKGAQPSWSAFRVTAYQHALLTLSGGTLRVDAVQVDGKVLDSFTLAKEVPPPSEPAPVPQPSEPEPPSPPDVPADAAPSEPIERAPPDGEAEPDADAVSDADETGSSGCGASGPALGLLALSTLVGLRLKRRRASAE